MKRYFSSLFLLLFFVGCKNENSGNQSQAKDSVRIVSMDKSKTVSDTSMADDSEGDSLDSTETDNEFQIFYLVTIAEGNNYDSLVKIAHAAAKKLNLKYDQLNRIYKPGKGIILKEDDEDEIYRGAYFPRRLAGNFVSIEMKDAFIKSETQPMRMLVISNIFELASQADSVVKLVKNKFPSAQSVEAKLFTGCMH
jgi:hypothetical protein